MRLKISFCLGVNSSIGFYLNIRNNDFQRQRDFPRNGESRRILEGRRKGFEDSLQIGFILPEKFQPLAGKDEGGWVRSQI